ncbi:hypothetical protein NIES3585_39570 [Nodularia sp. NIES-3585]|nr:hypothetical protein NIES3585_39570 [Nodularia sp. NIES-3585]
MERLYRYFDDAGKELETVLLPIVAKVREEATYTKI